MGAATHRFWPALAFAMLAAPVASQGMPESAAVEFARQAETLKPGQWVWAAEIAPRGPVLVYVDLARQLATVYRNGVRIAVTTVSTGKPGHDTPTGVFTILQKDANHHSSKYNNAPMPFQQRLTWDGVALHAGGLPGYPESHGCVHLPISFAKRLFATTDMGGTVVVAGRAGDVHSAAPAGLLASQAPGGAQVAHDKLAEGEEWRWQPELAPSGPLSVVISRADQRVVVLRGGVEIGRARATLPGEAFETHVFALTSADTTANEWVLVGVPGHAGEAGHPADPWTLDRVRLPGAFRERLVEALKPGATVLVTSSPLVAGNPGRPLTILSASRRT